MIEPDPTSKWYKLGAEAFRSGKSMGPMPTGGRHTGNAELRAEIIRIGQDSISDAEKNRLATEIMKQYQYGWFLTSVEQSQG